MAGPKSIPKRQVPQRVLLGTRLPDTVKQTSEYVSQMGQFQQTYFTDIQRGLSDNNGQSIGGIVNAAELASRQNAYEAVSAIAPHILDLSSQPSAVSYDGPLNVSVGTLPAGVNPTYIYARWTGYLFIPTAGAYNFALACTDGGNLFVNQTMIVGALTTNSAISLNGNIALQVGPVPIVVEWQVGTDPPALTLMWTPPGGAQALVPSSVMSRSINPPASGFLLGYYWNGSAAHWMP